MNLYGEAAALDDVHGVDAHRCMQHRGITDGLLVVDDDGQAGALEVPAILGLGGISMDHVRRSNQREAELGDNLQALVGQALIASRLS